jgi:iron complex transport system substrate-binding protein
LKGYKTAESFVFCIFDPPIILEVVMFFRSVEKIVFFILCFFIVVSGCSKIKSPEKKINSECKRIVSTAPSITETLFRFGYGDRIVGVTDDCVFPEKVKNIEHIGRVLNVNIEKILTLKPDVVMVIDANQDLKNKMRSLGINVLSFDHSTIQGFMESLPAIASECGKKPELDKMISQYSKALSKPEITGKKRKVMMVVGRDYYSSSVKDVYLAGNDGFYSEIIKACGLENVYKGDLSYPKIQVEGIVSMNPDVIVDIVTLKQFTPEDKKNFKKVWSMLGDVKAVATDQVFIMNNNYWSIPGPRFPEIIDDLKDMLVKNE